MKRIGTTRTPGGFARLTRSASSRSRIHGAPITSNGVSVPRPTETLVVSNRPMPGYSTAAVSDRMFGDGLTHARPVSCQ